MPQFCFLLSIFLTLSLASLLVLASQQDENPTLQERTYTDPFIIFNRKRNAHACMMSIVFLVLYPLGAISLHLPLPSFLKSRIRIIPTLHAPIQLLGLAMMIGAMGLGIDNALFLGFFSGGASMVPAHAIIGLLATSMIILIQPAMGILQHRHFRKTGKRSVWGYIHRWNGRVAVVLGMVNQGLGFQLTGIGTVVHTHSLVRNFLVCGLLAGVWFGLVVWDALRERRGKEGAVEQGGVEREDTKIVK
ncbi:hypothetical protein L207DRAFT_562003 [Hyaloscypha variabilis F]|uniref:Cytochrome b561 domain-containing protein n=1 Tax=Hyaloscypha variabilis (strain UAMH 11265 / GT02V1 / F) TaxID=1149755 RepID=A0A2J6S7I8_HYAVF|nr:hypothetical protein L207DRAFT_562003 [Hyaloscypha variabilis F]